MKAGKIALAALVSALAFAPMSVMAAPKTMPDGTLFDAEYYAANNPDVVAAFGTSEAALYSHYQTFGRREGRLPVAPPAQNPASTSTTSSVFDPTYYAAKYPDVVAALGSDPAMLKAHYDICGKAEGRYANAAEEQAAIQAAQAAQAAREAAQAAAQAANQPVAMCERAVEYLNREREEAYRNRIELSYTVLNCAFTRAEELVENYSKTRPGGLDYRTVLTAAGVEFSDAAQFYIAGLETPEEAMRYFLKTENDILMKNHYWTKAGGGYHYDASAKGCYWVLILTR